MTIDEAIADFELEFPDHHWTILKNSYDNGKFHGEKYRTIGVTNPYNSSYMNYDYLVVCEDITEGFLEMKRLILGQFMNDFIRKK